MSSGSQFFKKIHQRNPPSNSLSYLKIKHNYLNSLVIFIYTGECEVEQHHIESFLVLAKNLKEEGHTSESELDRDSYLPNMNKLEKEPVGIIDTQIKVKTENLDYKKNW